MFTAYAVFTKTHDLFTMESNMKLNKLALALGTVIMSTTAFAAGASTPVKAVMEAFAIVESDSAITDENGLAIDNFIVQLRHQGDDVAMRGVPTLGGSPLNLYVTKNTTEADTQVEVSFVNKTGAAARDEAFFISNAQGSKMDFTIAVGGVTNDLANGNDVAELTLSEPFNNKYRAPLDLKLTSTEVYNTYADGHYKNNFDVVVRTKA
jgi:hypothetical protein